MPAKREICKSGVRFGGLLCILAALLLGLIVLGLCVGRYSITPLESMKILLSKVFPIEPSWKAIAEDVVFQLRLPRILASVCVGASLAMAGASYQGAFQNPLVSPDLLGVSSGACVGAAIGILSGFHAAGIQALAFLSGILAVALTLFIPKLLKNNTNIVLVLSGIIVGSLMGSILSFIKYVADPETELAAITYWQMGSFSYVTYRELLSVLPVLAFGCIGLLLMGWQIDLLSLGETEARLLGVQVKRIRNFTILCSTLLTAGSVCISGTIGWIGLVIPHFARMFVGPNNTRLLPTSALLGGIFLVVADTCTRTITNTELPIGVLTGVIGAPFYILLLFREKTRLQ